MSITLFTSILQFHSFSVMPHLSVGLQMQLAQGYAIIEFFMSFVALVFCLLFKMLLSFEWRPILLQDVQLSSAKKDAAK